MLLKPFSVNSVQTYKEFLLQNYFFRIPDKGLKKINLKGINKIGSANNEGFHEFAEADILQRSVEDYDLNTVLVASEEKPALTDLMKARFVNMQQNGKLSFSNTGSAFSIELLDIIFLDELKSGELIKSLEIIKDSMIFAEKGNIFESFAKCLESYEKYLENPSDHKLFSDTKEELESGLETYEANPFAHFLLGLIYHRPTSFFDPEKSVEAFLKAKKFSEEIEDHYLKALSDFMISWLFYLKRDFDAAVDYLQKSADEEFLGIPETYYNLSKFYAAKNDADKAVAYLDEAVARFDFFYALKADLDDDFKEIKSELQTYFEKLRKEEREKVSAMLSELGVSVKAHEMESKAENSIPVPESTDD